MANVPFSFKFFIILCCAMFSTSVSGQIMMEKLQRGQSCENKVVWYTNINPKFNIAREESNNACDDSKGLICMQSEDPEFKQDGFESSGTSGKVCNCMENYYWDFVSQECRILIGLACDPNLSGESTWKDKCPEDGFCSQNVGRYGPRGAKGMCRCKDGFYVNSFWFVGGGGTTCENSEEETKRNKQRMDSQIGGGDESPDYPNTFSLQQL